MTLLRIGGNLINERFFIGLFDMDAGINGRGERIYAIEARWIYDGKLFAQVVGTYAYDDAHPEEQWAEEMTKASNRIIPPIGKDTK